MIVSGSGIGKLSHRFPFLVSHSIRKSSLEAVNIATALVTEILDLSHSSILCNASRSEINLTHFLRKSSRQAVVEKERLVLCLNAAGGTKRITFDFWCCDILAGLWQVFK